MICIKSFQKLLNILETRTKQQTLNLMDMNMKIS